MYVSYFGTGCGCLSNMKSQAIVFLFYRIVSWMDQTNIVLGSHCRLCRVNKEAITREGEQNRGEPNSDGLQIRSHWGRGRGVSLHARSLLLRPTWSTISKRRHMQHEPLKPRQGIQSGFVQRSLDSRAGQYAGMIRIIAAYSVTNGMPLH